MDSFSTGGDLSYSIIAQAKVVGIEDFQRLEAQMKSVAAGVDTLTASSKAGTTATAQQSAAMSGLEAGLRRLALQYLGITAIVQEFKKAVSAGFNFDEQLDKLSVSVKAAGQSWQQIQDGIKNTAYAAAKGTIFDPTQVLGAMEKFRDAGYDVSKVTKDQLTPVIQLSTATMQDLGDVTDATVTAMRQFQIPATEISRVVELQNNAFHEAGLTASEFTSAISAAGAAALASGTSLEQYTAIVVRMKELGQTPAQAAQFEKLFSAALINPTAKQLKAFRDGGVDPLLPSNANDEAIKNAQTAMDLGNGLQKTRLGRGLGKTITDFEGPRLAELQAQKEEAVAAHEVRDQLIALAEAQDTVTGQIHVYDQVIAAVTEKIKGLKDAQGDWKQKLSATTDEITKQKDALSQIKDQLAQLADPKITGMDAFDDEIAQLSLTAKGQELQIMRTEDAMGSYGDSLTSTKQKASDLRSELEKLKSVELNGEKAFNEQAYQLQEKIKAAQLEQLQLKPYQLFESNAIGQQIAKLQKQFQITNLKKDLEFDPAHHAIDAAVDANSPSMSAADAVARANAISAALPAATAQQDALDATNRAIKEKQLEKDTTFGPEELAIKKAQREASERLGLQPSEQSAGALLASIPGLEKAYKDVNGSIQTLEIQKNQIQKVIGAYDSKIDEQTTILDGYKKGLDAAKLSEQLIKKATADLEEQFAGMSKPMKDQVTLLDEMAKAGFSAQFAYELLGKRGGAAMIALLGPDNENLTNLKEMVAQWKELNTLTDDAQKVNDDGYGDAARAAAAKRTAEIGIGEATINIVHGVINAAKNADTSTQGWKDFFTGVGITIKENISSGGTAADPYSLKHYETHAMGGIVGGYGNTDSVPAMLTPGEEVLRRDDPRHVRNGGGEKVTINFNGPVSMRSEEDVKALMREVSSYLENERKRAAAGMP